MRGSEIRKRIYICILAVLLILCLPAAVLRLTVAAPYIDGDSLAHASGLHGMILDYNGDILYDGHNDLYEGENGKQSSLDKVMGNTLGGYWFTDNGIADCYAEALAPDGIGCLSGLKGLADTKPKSIRTSLLPLEDQETLASMMGDYHGSIFAMNYETGDIYTAISLPSAAYYNEENPDSKMAGCLTNKCLTGQYIPGSIMKIVTATCALDQDPELLNLSIDCLGELELPWGDTVICDEGYPHGYVDMTSATGYSCNCFYVTLAQMLDPIKLQKTLNGMGFVVNGKGESSEQMGEQYWLHNRVEFESLTSTDDLWSFVGQGKTLVSPIHMAMFAGALASGGEVAVPHMLTSFEDPNTEKVEQAYSSELRRLVNEDTANLVQSMWSNATELKYRSGEHALRPEITCAKTGTAQYGGGVLNLALLGYMEAYHTSFLIIVEDLPYGNPLPKDIANALCTMLPSVSETSEAE